MGRFLNPDYSAFKDVLDSKIYVDKTELLEYTNSVINTTSKFICNSRPRRFGKSITANMMTAYYSKGCDSRQMFSKLKISEKDSYEENLNKYDVIHFDVQWCIEPAGSVEKVVSFITENVINELRVTFTDICPKENITLPDMLSRIYDATGRKFIVIIDEWDVQGSRAYKIYSLGILNRYITDKKTQNTVSIKQFYPVYYVKFISTCTICRIYARGSNQPV